jgi:2,3-bisphosphoglycerate-independent phosphoglycerate mutase
MDRDNRWDGVAKAYDVIATAVGRHFQDARMALPDAYTHEIGDEFVLADSDR